MTNPDERLFYFLKKLSGLPEGVNMLEMGSIASPQSLKAWAARGMVRVEISITPRGTERLQDESLKRLRKKTKAEKKDRQRSFLRLAEAA